MSQKVSVLCLFMVCMGCETVVDIDPPSYDTELVVSSLFSPDSLWAIELHRSLSIGVRQNPLEQYVEGSIVTLWSGDEMIDSLFYRGHGRYRSVSRFPSAGIPYTLRVELPGMPEIEATSSVPLSPVITYSSLELLGEKIKFPYGHEGVYKIQLRFTDPPGSNFYRIAVYRYTRFQGQDYHNTPNAPDSVYRRVELDAADPGWLFTYTDAAGTDLVMGDLDDTCSVNMVTDRLFDGEEYSWEGRLLLVEEWGRDNVLLLLSTLSEDYFEYQRTVQEQSFSGPFIEPIKVHSNVEGGLGIFAGYNNTCIILSLSTSS